MRETSPGLKNRGQQAPKEDKEAREYPELHCRDQAGPGVNGQVTKGHEAHHPKGHPRSGRSPHLPLFPEINHLVERLSEPIFQPPCVKSHHLRTRVNSRPTVYTRASPLGPPPHPTGTKGSCAPQLGFTPTFQQVVKIRRCHLAHGVTHAGSRRLRTRTAQRPCVCSVSLRATARLYGTGSQTVCPK